MKLIGIVGGLGPESTIEYYRFLIADYRDRITDGSYPRVVIDSMDANHLVGLITTGRLSEATELLLEEISRLAAAGAEIGLVAANTPHLVFDSLRARSPIPLVSIVEAARDRAAELGLQRVGLLGTRFTMEASFYPEVFSKKGIAVSVPSGDDAAFVHRTYMDELFYGVVRPEARLELHAIVERMKAHDGIDGVILGGTELSLIIKDAEIAAIPVLDTTVIHVQRSLDEALGVPLRTS